ncbi:MAG: O-antigen ligase family protein [Planctomycetota bacterium]
MSPFAARAALALLAAAALVRLFSSGGGVELLHPGAQVLFDALALVAALVAVLARALEHEAPLAGAGAALWALLPWTALLALGAARAAHPDLAWRTALTWTALPLLALCARDLCAREPALGRWLAGFLLACVGVGAALGAWEYLVEIPARIAEFEAGGLADELSIRDRGMRIALTERLHSRQATGPYLLPGLLASACCALLPLAGVALWARRRAPAAAGAALGVALLLAGLVLSKSKGGVVTLAGVAGVLALLLPALAPWRRGLALAALVVMALLGVVGAVALGLGPERIGVGLSLTVRMEYWEAALRAWREAPLLGLGPNQFREYFLWAKSLRAEETLHAHQLALQVLAEGGLLGLAALGGALCVWARQGARAVLSAGRVEGPGASGAGEPGAGGSAGSAAASWDARSSSATPAAATPAAVSPAAASSRPSEADAPAPAALVAALLGGVALGWFLLGAYGDCYNASTPRHWVTILLGVLALTPLFAWALREVPAVLLGAAALAGASTLLWDGLLDFGFHHAGLSTLCWLLLGLAPALAGRLPADVGPARLRALAAVPLGALALALLFWLVPAALDAEQAREAARRVLDQAALDEQAGRKQDARAKLVQAEELLEAACAGYPWDLRTWLERAATLARLARLAPDAELGPLRDASLAALERALACDPRSHDAWYQEAELLLEAGPARWQAAEDAYAAALALYPGHPELCLDAAELQVRRWRRGRDPAYAAKARELLRRAREASAATRLVRRKLTQAQLDRLARLEAELARE